MSCGTAIPVSANLLNVYLSIAIIGPVANVGYNTDAIKLRIVGATVGSTLVEQMFQRRSKAGAMLTKSVRLKSNLQKRPIRLTEWH
jgi:hypothetical protein